MSAVGFDPTSGSIVVTGNGVYPARTLRASLTSDGHIQIVSLAGRSENFMAWRDITDLSGNGFSSSSAVLAYLQIQFSLQNAIGETFGTPAIAGTALSQGMPLAISRATGRILPARADTYTLSFVAGVAPLDTASGFSVQPAHGAVTLSDWTSISGSPTLSVGSPYFLAAEGGITTMPSPPACACASLIGTATTATTLIVAPTFPILF